MVMLERLDDASLGLVLRGNLLVPNPYLQTLISVYTPQIVEAMLSEHVKIVQIWLDKLHAEYISAKRSCSTENDPIACYGVTTYDEFERRYASWQDGGLIEISLPERESIWVRNSSTVTSSAGPVDVARGQSLLYACKKCGTSFKTLDELDAHIKKEKEVKPIKRSYTLPSRDGIPPNPIWWPAES